MKSTDTTYQPLSRSGAPSTTARRLRTYQQTMFPFGPRLIQAGLFGGSFAMLLVTITGAGELPGIHTLVAIADILLLSLLLRLMDELKDFEIDRRLFPERPLPSGQVTVRDIRIALALVGAAYAGLNAAFTAIFLPAGLAFMYSWLMYFHFFAVKRHRRSLPLSLATHNPITALMLLIVLAGYSVDIHAEVQLFDALATVALYWSLILSWEIARKIRRPVEEDDYVTYSRLLGYNGAVGLLVGLQTLPPVLIVLFTFVNDLNLLYPILVGFAYILALASHYRTWRMPARANRFRTDTEVYIVTVCVAIVAAGLVQLTREW